MKKRIVMFLATVIAFLTANAYTVTLSMQGGSGGTSSFSVDFGQEMPSITPPTRSGYKFAGYWTGKGGSGTMYYNWEGKSAYRWDRTTATTLYAYWVEPSCTVTLDQTGGSGGTSSVTATYGSAMPSITPPTRTGYWFLGYWTGTGQYGIDNGANGKKYYDWDGKSARTWDREEAATTLYAYWVAERYTVTLDQQGGGGGTSSVTATYDSLLPSITLPTLTGYIFAGYWTSLD